MTLQQIIALLLYVVTICYIAWGVKKKGEGLESISETAYIFEDAYGRSSLFTAYCVIMAFGLMMAWTTSSTNILSVIASVIGCCGMLYAGCTPYFREKDNAVWHYGGGMTAYCGYTLWMAFEDKPFQYFVYTIVPALILTAIRRKCWLFFFEIAALATLLSTLLLD